MNFATWLESFPDKHNGLQLFKAMFANMADADRVLVFCDWLEEAGFPGTAELIRSRIDKTKPHGYWDKMKAELAQHGMSIEDNGTLKWIPHNDSTYGWRFFRLTHDQIQTRMGRWVNAEEENVDLSEIVPGLAALLFSYVNSNNYSTSHLSDVQAGMFWNKWSQYLPIRNRIIENIHASPRRINPLFERLSDFCDDLANLIKGFEDNAHNNRRWHDTFHESLVSLRDELVEQGIIVARSRSYANRVLRPKLNNLIDILGRQP